MRVLVACKRGGFGPRDKSGHCLCPACKEDRKQYRIRTREQKREYNREWARRNPEKVSAYSKKWITANVAQRREIEKAWRAANLTKVADMSYRAGAKWSRANRGKRNFLTRKRVACKLRRTPAWVDFAAIELIYAEAARLTETTGIPHEVDHVFPLQGMHVSGLHVAENLQILTRAANRSKHNRIKEQRPSESL